LLGVLALIVLQIRAGRFSIRFHAAPRAYPLPLFLALGGTALYLVVERFFDINTVSASLFGLASYGLVGLWMSPRSWRAGLPAALLLIGVLPFGEHMQTFIGYPMRSFTAAVARDGLAAFGIPTGGADTILILENSVSQIDSPCSGIKSLWTGALFFLAVTWLDRRALNGRWLLIAGIFAALLFLANVLRVVALVITAQVLQVPVLAGMLHVPLGVLGFAGACLAAIWVLRFRSGPLQESIKGSWDLPPLPIPQLTPALVVALCAMALLYAQRPAEGLSQAAPDWNFPVELHTAPLPLKPDEVAWLTRDGAESAGRFRFEWQGLGGSMILVPSRTWRAHHRPERCFEVFGLQLLNSRATTAPAERWVLVSILFDGAVDPGDTRVSSLYRALHTSVAHQLD
jgi:exosortase O